LTLSDDKELGLRAIQSTVDVNKKLVREFVRRVFNEHNPDLASVSSPAPGDESRVNKTAALILVCLAQMMVVIDISIVNVALPSSRTRSEERAPNPEERGCGLPLR
jgi:hypothetical protein